MHRNGTGEFDSARKSLELALDKFPRDTIARYSYGVTLRSLGFAKEAEEQFERTRQARTALDQVRPCKKSCATMRQTPMRA